ncbi:NAD-dependent epimerase/dehydratase family protein [Arcticibacter eurypsychrophilus]|uniref:NAD-dependent epimerase/dehydratase family protein n=1 Tax=Arcticibacter eurypsychrophilus TaxID=1434752 RepID=UPI00084CFE6E|nr:polysaccharide biosynthesis protein [Arcticibacter eurypsychrophilus]
MNNKNMYTISSIFEKIWELSPKLHLPESYSELLNLTKQLIELYNAEGRLDENPFSPTTKRKLSLPVAEINDLLKSSTCIVTGGLGCVGSSLLNKLLDFQISKIIVIDKKPFNDKANTSNNRVEYIQADICNSDELNEIFATYQPEFVFHTAAQRDPGFAENHIFDAVNINVIGTWNLAKACENTPSVKQCVFSSTGKSSRYYTDEVYSATKKICELIFDTYARRSDVLYSIVRFTHILDNSLMDIEFQNARNADHLSLHSPGKYVTAQNVQEAADLMLNALLHSTTGKANFLIVRNLEWPVESLEVALYYIKEAGSFIPVIFRGNPPGYSEKFFRGQMDWSHPQELNLLINVYECKDKSYNEEGDIIISHVCPVDEKILLDSLIRIQNTEGENCSKVRLLTELKILVRAALKKVDKRVTFKILEWGLKPQYLKAEGTTIAHYGPTVSLLIESLEDSEYSEQIKDLIVEKNIS